MFSANHTADRVAGDRAKKSELPDVPSKAGVSGLDLRAAWVITLFVRWSLATADTADVASAGTTPLEGGAGTDADGGDASDDGFRRKRRTAKSTPRDPWRSEASRRSDTGDLNKLFHGVRLAVRALLGAVGPPAHTAPAGREAEDDSDVEVLDSSAACGGAASSSCYHPHRAAAAAAAAAPTHRPCELPAPRASASCAAAAATRSAHPPPPPYDDFDDDLASADD